MKKIFILSLLIISFPTFTYSPDKSAWAGFVIGGALGYCKYLQDKQNFEKREKEQGNQSTKKPTWYLYVLTGGVAGALSGNVLGRFGTNLRFDDNSDSEEDELSNPANENLIKVSGSEWKKMMDEDLERYRKIINRDPSLKHPNFQVWDANKFPHSNRFFGTGQNPNSKPKQNDPYSDFFGDTNYEDWR